MDYHFNALSLSLWLYPSCYFGTGTLNLNIIYNLTLGSLRIELLLDPVGTGNARNFRFLVLNNFSNMHYES